MKSSIEIFESVAGAGAAAGAGVAAAGAAAVGAAFAGAGAAGNDGDVAPSERGHHGRRLRGVRGQHHRPRRGAVRGERIGLVDQQARGIGDDPFLADQVQELVRQRGREWVGHSGSFDRKRLPPDAASGPGGG